MVHKDVILTSSKKSKFPPLQQPASRECFVFTKHGCWASGNKLFSIAVPNQDLQGAHTPSGGIGYELEHDVSNHNWESTTWTCDHHCVCVVLGEINIMRMFVRCSSGIIKFIVGIRISGHHLHIPLYQESKAATIATEAGAFPVSDQDFTLMNRKSKSVEPTHALLHTAVCPLYLFRGQSTNILLWPIVRPPPPLLLLPPRTT